MPIEIARSRKGLRRLFAGFDEDIRAYFSEFRALVDSDLSLDVLLAYVFFRLEQGQRMTLYCGARKLHKTEYQLTWNAIESQHLTREAFQKCFESIYAVPIPPAVLAIIAPAEKIRDRLMHGKDLDDAGLREAISRVLHFADAINHFLDDQNVGFRPFVGDLRGFIGRLSSLEKSTSRLILKGMGFQGL